MNKISPVKKNSVLSVVESYVLVIGVPLLYVKFESAILTVFTLEKLTREGSTPIVTTVTTAWSCLVFTIILLLAIETLLNTTQNVPLNWSSTCAKATSAVDTRLFVITK